MTEVAELKKASAGASASDPKPPAAAAAAVVASEGICYWPDQSCDSLPPLPGKVAAGLVGGRGMEFSVNEECEFGLRFVLGLFTVHAAAFALAAI